ncbi:uncharacterized protein LOC121875790 [Homarus americanus]|uniref:uncharacterized protein LOC121875790 n=1 Tax=Homarus americanus TaxID=6706 RepID=UPI001C472849|nr:uncharacterized protein LOC121875790 [Homarus americanus]
MKTWGNKEFWGLGSEFDPDWLLTDQQKQLRADLMDVCRTKIRPHAIQCDRNYQFPRQSVEDLAELGLMGLIIPKEFGGLGENHICAAMVVETLARYGCPSTAMIYTMHLASCSVILFRYHNNPHLQQLLTRITQEKLLGAVSASDPATGGHDWFPLSSKVKYLDKRTIQMLKFGSWTTSAGFADFYTIMTVSPEYNGNYSNLSMFVSYQDEIRASTDNWSALGMHGNQSGPIVVEGKFDLERMIGSPYDGKKIMEECIDTFFLLLTSSCWNGIALGCIDLAKKHVTHQAHADVGMRVCDYPCIQDYIGESIIETNSSRSMTFLLAQSLDTVTKNGDWSIHSDFDQLPRTGCIHWLWQLKFVAAKNVGAVTEKMLYACGGSGYKTNLGLERLFRDGKAGCIMAPSNEVLRNLVGVAALTGFTSIDLWEESTNERIINREVRKMTAEEKVAMGQRLLDEAAQEQEGNIAKHPYQESDFDNPFNTAPPAVVREEVKTSDGILHKPALNPDSWTELALSTREDISDKTTSFVFSLPNTTDHTGCLPGQYVTVRITNKGKQHLRYFSPVSRPNDYGRIELVLRYETQGIISNHFKALQPGDKVEFQGPCGGFEYVASQLDELILLASGGGVTPALQLIRSLVNSPADPTRFTLLYFSDTYEDILYRSELDGYASKDERLQVVYTLGEVPEGWEGEEGFIDTQMLNKYISKPDNSLKRKIVVCGGPSMSISCIYSLQTLGFPPQNTFVYGQFGAEQIKAVYGRHVSLSGHRCNGNL